MLVSCYFPWWRWASALCCWTVSKADGRIWPPAILPSVVSSQCLSTSSSLEHLSTRIDLIMCIGFWIFSIDLKPFFGTIDYWFVQRVLQVLSKARRISSETITAVQTFIANNQTVSKGKLFDFMYYSDTSSNLILNEKLFFYSFYFKSILKDLTIICAHLTNGIIILATLISVLKH